MKYIIAIGLGGTKTVIALMGNGKIIKKIKRLTSQKGKEHVIKDLLYDIGCIIEGFNKEDLIGVGIGVASPVDTKNGIVIFAPHIKGLKNFRMKQLLENKLHLPVFVENDSNLEAMGEYAAKRVKILASITLGTGLGFGLVVNGKIYNGLNSAMELGHMIINNEGLKCNCGSNGCFEAYVSGNAISRRFKQKYKKNLTSLEISNLALRGNKNAKKLLNETGYYLGIGLINIINIFDPDIIVLNGGVSKLGYLILKSAKRTIDNVPIVRYKGKIIISVLGEDALLYGADYLVRHEYFV